MGALRRITEDYRLDKLVHSSDAGSVFCATDLRSGETVAVKLIVEVDERSQEQREAFERFAQALRSLHHPAVPWTLDFGFTTAGTAFLVTEYCNGVSLELLEGSAPERLVALLLQVAEALEALAAQGIPHGKLRADNVLVLPGSTGADGGDGEGRERVKLLGLGVPASHALADGVAAGRRALAELTCRLLGASYDAAAPAPQVVLPASAARLEDPATLGSWLEAVLCRPAEGRDAPAGAASVFRRALGASGVGAPPWPPLEARHEQVAPQGARSPAPAPPAPIERTVVLSGPALRLAAEATARKAEENQGRAAGDQPAALPAGMLPALAAAAGTPRALAARAAGSQAGRESPTMVLVPGARPSQARAAATPSEALPGAPVTPGSVERTLRIAAISPPAPPAAPEPPLPPVPAPAERQAAMSFQNETLAVYRPPAPSAELTAAPPPAPVLPLKVPGEEIGTGTAPPAPSPAAEALEATTPRFQPRHGASGAAVGTVLGGVAAEDPARRASTLPEQVPVAPAGPAAPLARTASAGAGSGLRRWLLPAILGAAVAASGVGIVVLVSHGRTTKPAAAPVKVAAPPPRPRPAPAVAPAPPPVNPQLELAEAYLASGNKEGARQALASIPAERQAAFSAVERERYQKASTALENDRREQLVKELVDGLGSGKLSRLNDALASAKGMTDLPAAVQRDLERAKRAVALAARLTRAQRSRNYAEVFTVAAQLQQILPAYDKAADAREQAARALEADADAAIEAGQFDRAQAALESLRAAVPDRPQLAERLARIGAQRQADAQLEAALGAAARAEHASQPLQGLELLAGTKANSRYAERFRQQRERLSELLARLDSAPPKVTLREGSKLEYEKGKTARVQLRVTDDFQVKSVEGWARPEGGSYQQVPVRHGSGADYTVEIPEAVHDNKTVEVYVTASDLSGHQGALGSSQDPLKLKRKGWFSKLLGGKE